MLHTSKTTQSLLMSFVITIQQSPCFNMWCYHCGCCTV